MKNQYKLSLFLLGFVFLLAGCGKKIYKTSTSFEQSITYSRKLVAILPFEVSSQDDTAIDEAAYKNREQAYLVQKEMSSAFVYQFSRKRYNIDFQDIDKTNEILRSNRITYEELQTRDRTQICRLLRVDAIISGVIRSSAPLLDGNTQTVIGINPQRKFPNPTTFTININEQSEGKLVWNYTYDTPSIVGNKIQALTSDVMGDVAAKFPYRKK